MKRPSKKDAAVLTSDQPRKDFKGILREAMEILNQNIHHKTSTILNETWFVETSKNSLKVKTLLDIIQEYDKQYSKENINNYLGLTKKLRKILLKIQKVETRLAGIDDLDKFLNHHH